MNNVLYEACLASHQEWIDSFMPLEEHEFSDRHNKKMKALFARIRNNKYHRLTRNAVRAIIIAAIILSIAITAFAIQAVKAYNAYNLNLGTVYESANRNEITVGKNLIVDYIPDGYVLSNELYEKHFATKLFLSEDNSTIIIEKHILNSESFFNTEIYPYEEINNNGIKYIYYFNEYYNCLIWNNNEYTYIINSDLPKEEILLIAYSTT